jgi:hypothetical protein
MRYRALAGCAIFVFLIAACAPQEPQNGLVPPASNRQDATVAAGPGTSPRTPNVAARTGIVSIRGIVVAFSERNITIATKSRGRLRASIDAKTIVHGHARNGELVQVVGVGSTRIRAEYAAFWHEQVPVLTASGSIAYVAPLGFVLAESDGTRVMVILTSSTAERPERLGVGDGVAVSGSGSVRRAIVAARVELKTGTPTPSPSPSSTPTAAPSPSATSSAATAPTPTPIVLYPGRITGEDNLFTPNDGDTPSGGQSQTVDGIPCAPTMFENTYHVHAYLGILVNGQQVAIPTQIGLYKPGPPSNGFTSTAQCYYYIHTHDSSGYIHIESPTSTPLSASVYALQNVFDVWGMSLSSNNVGPFNGQVRVFIATVPLGTLTAGNYQEYTGNPNAIALYSHEAIWLEVGPSFVVPPNLPDVTFYTEY